jgi:hypothetical protein
MLAVSFVTGFARSGTALADAEPKATVAVDWNAPNGECPDRQHVLDAVMRTIGTGASGHSPLFANARVDKESPDHWLGRVDLSDTHETAARRVEGESCAAVSDALVMIIALAAAPVPVAMPLETPSAKSPAPREPSASPRANPAISSRWRPLIGASALFDIGSLPSSDFGAEVFAGIARGAVVLDAVGTSFQSSTASLSARPTEGATFSLLRLAARGCYRFVKESVQFGPCLEIGEEWMRARGFGSTSPSNADGETFAPSVGAHALARFSPNAGLRLDAEEGFPMARPRYVIDNTGTVFRGAPATFRASAGAELLF